MRLQLNETNFKNILTEMVKEVLLENRRTDKEKQSTNIIYGYFGGKLELPYCKAITSAFKHEFYNNESANTNKINLLPTITKLLLPKIFNTNNIQDKISFNEKTIEIDGTNQIVVDNAQFKNGVLDNIIKKFISTVINYVFDNNKITEFINNYKNNSYTDLWDRRQEFGFDENQYENQSHTYQMVGPFTINGEDNTLSFKDAKKYGDKSAQGSKICYTQSVETYCKYLKRGNNVLYIFLRNDWETVPQVHTDCTIFPDNPEWDGYDDYGLSMLFIIINPVTGKLEYCNTRWNHGGKYKPEFGSDVDHVLSINELTQIVDKELIKQIIPIDEELQQFSEVESIGNGLYIVRTENGRNIYNKKTKSLEIVNADNQPIWFDYINASDNNLFWVRTKYKENYLVPDKVNGDYKCVFGDIKNPDTWFNYMRMNNDYSFRVRENGKLNYLVPDDNGGYKLVYGDINDTNTWFDEIRKKDDKSLVVKKNDKYNYLVSDGNGRYKLLFGTINNTDTWFDGIRISEDNLFWVLKNDKENYLVPDKVNGDYKCVFGDINNSDTWFDEIWKIRNFNSFTLVKNGKYNYLVPDGNGEYKEITSDEYQQYRKQQNQPLNEIINRLVRNYRRY